MKKIIGLGNCLVDVLIKLNNNGLLGELDLPSGSMQLIDINRKETIDARLAGEEKDKVPGGSAANTIKALAAKGVEVGFIGKIADDNNGSFFADTLESVGVKTCLTRSPEGATGVANTFISPDGQRTFATYLGISGSLSPADVTKEKLSGYDILYVEGYLVQNYDLMNSVMQTARELGMTICLDLASYNIVEDNLDFFRHMVEDYVDIVFANEEESHALTGLAPAEALDWLSNRCRVAVVKLGANGSSACMDGEKTRVPACKVDKVVDTTGAGDYFAAGFLCEFIKGQSLTQCLRKGSELSARIIQVIGCPI